MFHHWQRFGFFLLALGLIFPAIAYGQCATELENLASSDREYLGLRWSGEKAWVGQQFATDCNGKFLTVSFMIDVQPVESLGVTNLTVGNTLTCTIMDDQNQPIASVDQQLTKSFGFEWVEFDFGPHELGLAAGTLAAKISTPHDAYCLVGKSNDLVPGQLMVGDESTLNYVGSRDSTFRVTWDPDAIIVGVEERSWGEIKALYR